VVEGPCGRCTRFRGCGRGPMSSGSCARRSERPPVVPSNERPQQKLPPAQRFIVYCSPIRVRSDRSGGFTKKPLAQHAARAEKDARRPPRRIGKRPDQTLSVSVRKETKPSASYQRGRAASHRAVSPRVVPLGIASCAPWQANWNGEFSRGDSAPPGGKLARIGFKLLKRKRKQFPEGEERLNCPCTEKSASSAPNNTPRTPQQSAHFFLRRDEIPGGDASPRLRSVSGGADEAPDHVAGDWRGFARLRRNRGRPKKSSPVWPKLAPTTGDLLARDSTEITGQGLRASDVFRRATGYQRAFLPPVRSPVRMRTTSGQRP